MCAAFSNAKNHQHIIFDQIICYRVRERNIRQSKKITFFLLLFKHSFTLRKSFKQKAKGKFISKKAEKKRRVESPFF